MNEITVTFTYDLPDDQYYETRTLNKTATLTYTGPAKKYVIVDKETNCPTGASISEEVHQTYNDTNDEFFSVEVDCATNPELCSLIGHYTISGQTEISEEIPDCDPYVRMDPPDPFHTFSWREIEYNPVADTWHKPFPWRKPFQTWEFNLAQRNIALSASDKRLSEDLPEVLYNKMIEYKNWLRDIPETFGLNWIINLTSMGTGFSVGNRISISDPVYKLGQSIPDIILTITEVDQNGGIIKFNSTNCRALHQTSAITYENLYHTTDGNGTGAVIQLTKTKLLDPWKIKFKDCPLG